MIVKDKTKNKRAMKRYLYTFAILAIAGSSVSAQEFDDIYYNPKKDTSLSDKKKSEKKSNYIKDFSSIDVDTYNRRGQYYESPIDTIGLSAENNEDFVYTQKIQKFYNPYIVVENAGVLMDVLDNSYGNVEIVFENGLPYFNSIYGWPGYYNSAAWIPSWRWNIGYGTYWAYSPIWGWESWPTWSLGPAWAWVPVYAWGAACNWAPGGGPSWGWGQSWGWGPVWGPGYGSSYYANYRPNGRYPNYAGGNWANNTRPGGNINGNHYRPGYNGIHATNSNSTGYNYHRNYKGSTASSNRVNGTIGSSRTYNVGSDRHRRYGSTTSTGSSSNRYNNGSTTNSHRTTNTTRQSSSSSSYTPSRSQSTYTQSSGSYSRGSYNGGGSYGGGRSSGGSGRGRR